MNFFIKSNCEISNNSLLPSDGFLDSLINYDKENIHPEVIKAIQPYLKNPEFEPDFVRSKSGAAAGLCAWVINIIKFYEVYCDVEPKRRALEAANAELSAAQDKLLVITQKVASLEEMLAKLTADFEKATADKLRCQQEADATQATIQLANRLVGGLASENVRWAENNEDWLLLCSSLSVFVAGDSYWLKANLPLINRKALLKAPQELLSSSCEKIHLLIEANPLMTVIASFHFL